MKNIFTKISLVMAMLSLAVIFFEDHKKQKWRTRMNIDTPIDACGGSRGGSCLSVEDFDITEPVIDTEMQGLENIAVQPQPKVQH